MPELLQGIEMLMQYISTNGSSLNPETQQALAQLLSQANQLIESLSGGIGDIQPPEDLENAPYPSSNIHAFRYNPDNGQLFVKFQGKYPQNNGPVYSYQNVPPFIFDVFSRGAVAPKTSGSNKWHTWKKGVTPSLGASMHALIKAGGYPYKRLS